MRTEARGQRGLSEVSETDPLLELVQNDRSLLPFTILPYTIVTLLCSLVSRFYRSLY
jgi:hypothetical protein